MNSRHKGFLIKVISYPAFKINELLKYFFGEKIMAFWRELCASVDQLKNLINKPMNQLREKVF